MEDHHTCSGIFNEPVNAGMDMLVNREVAFMVSISVFPKKYSRSFAIELAIDSYCSTITLYMPMWKITIHVVAFSINQ